MSEFSLKDLILEAKNIKQAFVPAMPKEAGAMPPMDPAMMQGGAMPAPAAAPIIAAPLANNKFTIIVSSIFFSFLIVLFVPYLVVICFR